VSPADAEALSWGDLEAYREAEDGRRKELWRIAQYLAWWIVNGQRAAVGAKKMIPWEDFDPFPKPPEPVEVVDDNQHEDVITKIDTNIERILAERGKKKIKK
jgi:hypothetical protein